MADHYETKKDFGVSTRVADTPPTYDGCDIERVQSGTVRDQTHRSLKARHLQLIGIGGTIGTGSEDKELPLSCFACSPPPSTLRPDRSRSAQWWTRQSFDCVRVLVCSLGSIDETAFLLIRPTGALSSSPSPCVWPRWSHTCPFPRRSSDSPIAMFILRLVSPPDGTFSFLRRFWCHSRLQHVSYRTGKNTLGSVQS
jgi:hypothetical protein